MKNFPFCETELADTKIFTMEVTLSGETISLERSLKKKKERSKEKKRKVNVKEPLL